MQIKKVFCVGIIIFLTLLFSACASSIEGLYKDSNFTYAAIKESNIGVGGVTSAVSYLPIGEQTAYGEALRNLLIKKYHGMRVASAGAITHAIGQNQYNLMLNNFQNFATINDDDLNTLANRVKHTRYLAFTCIMQSEIEKNRSEEADISNNNNKIIKYETARTVKVAMKIYDTKEKTIVWSATAVETRSRSNDYNIAKLVNDKNNFDQNVTASAVETLEKTMLEKNYKYPSAPAETLLVSAALDNLVDKLPEFSQE